jgi:MoxR-like ATPase
MAEKKITIADETFQLDYPFLVMATQNPVEQEGTYNLPEAQLDRFMLKVVIGYNTPEEELEVIKRASNNSFEKVNAIADKKAIFEMQEQVKNIHIDDQLTKYIVDLVNATRVKHKYIDLGASPRSGISLYKASKAVAFMSGRDYVTPVDIASVVKDVFRHRIVLSYEAEADEVTADKVIEEIISVVPIP